MQLWQPRCWRTCQPYPTRSLRQDGELISRGSTCSFTSKGSQTCQPTMLSRGPSFSTRWEMLVVRRHTTCHLIRGQQRRPMQMTSQNLARYSCLLRTVIWQGQITGSANKPKMSSSDLPQQEHTALVRRLPDQSAEHCLPRGQLPGGVSFFFSAPADGTYLFGINIRQKCSVKHSNEWIYNPFTS